MRHEYQDNDLRELIKMHQYAKGLTKEEAAKQIGVSAPTYARYLADPARLSISTLRAICSKFGIKKEEVLQFIL